MKPHFYEAFHFLGNLIVMLYTVHVSVLYLYGNYSKLHCSSFGRVCLLAHV